MPILIDGNKISSLIKNEIKNEVSNFKNSKPCLAFILVGENKQSKVYLKNKIIACKYIGIESVLYNLEENIEEKELIKLIENLNNNKNINGILVQHPLPKHINESFIARQIDYKKDVDCFNPYNLGCLAEGDSIFNPCTPSACIEILERYNISFSGKTCVVIGRSNIVGKPLINMLIKKDATVICANSKTKNLKELTLMADIIFIAIGKANFLKKNMIKKGVIIIDIGINVNKDNKLTGDVYFEECKHKASLITPVPGGVGPVTIAMLMKNCLTAYKIQNKV